MHGPQWYLHSDGHFICDWPPLAGTTLSPFGRIFLQVKLVASISLFTVHVRFVDSPAITDTLAGLITGGVKARIVIRSLLTGFWSGALML